MDEDSRFHRTLKHPIVVTGLCLSAGFAIYSNLMPDTSETPGSLPVGLHQTPSTATPSPAIQLNAIHEEKAVQWIDHPERDPFSPMAIAPQSSVARSSTTIPGHAGSPELEKDLTLKAIAIEGTHRSAVINRSVVYEGEMIAGYQVVSIQPKGVLLKYKSRNRILTFSRIPAS